jgi:hypothetical protein
MKLQRLRKILETRSRTKIFVLTDSICLCGYACEARQEGDSVRVRIEASVCVVLGSTEVVEKKSNTGTLVLTPEHQVTRRIQTHLRHVEGMEIPESYLHISA